MNRLTVNVLNIAIAAALATGLAACNRNADAGVSGASADAGASASADAGVKYAKVVSVDPIRSTVNNPKQVCHDETVTHSEPPKDQHRIAGTAIGAVVGGLLGNQVGGGKGRTLATVAGAVGGGYAGNRIQASRQQAQVSTSVERKCDTVNNTSNKIVGYDVRYVYNGVTRTVRMDHDPGDRVQVQEGVTAVSDAR
ncbi:glycine zipper 2TM domain-containing protein [Rhodanobacter denitrificans]|uniref:Glycine zipper 2TM domain-containing protein n=1 Tax=Rhodanobacter denitrificans TaxID=666685 RepID=A0A368KG90_9GAMM|nr:glycine zipper 2TM domain-containing protein [Rhodanobacter denitrificans]RCS30929.1 glycine zipper 2TM domain-containing protein [Rhodanobacter denitrificans]